MRLVALPHVNSETLTLINPGSTNAFWQLCAVLAHTKKHKLTYARRKVAKTKTGRSLNTKLRSEAMESLNI